ncbi:MAG TPA: hypothetical protein VNO32_53245 [Candidatus Acidoferrum sp.]|jgi:hypothetical protein|nr:hypothetical protein [Candidatus Acidoferrum sp.]
MSTTSGAEQCPQCAWEEADYEYNGRECSCILMCRRCGYLESEIPEFDEMRRFRGTTHKITMGAGALGYKRKGGFAYVSTALHTSADVTRAQEWLRPLLKDGEVEDTAYVTRWNFEIEEVETILGKFYLNEEQIEKLAERNKNRTCDEQENVPA